MDWEGATAVVTGASRGIGAQVARLAVQRGARVGLIARSRSDLDELAAELGPEVVVAPADVSVPAQLEAALAEVRARLGPIDILVNNAGAGGYGPFLSSAADEAERLMQINYLAAVTATRWVLPEMLAARCGHIVTVGSISGRVAVPLEATYVASKFAVLGFSEALAFEVAPHGVGVSIVNPGPVATTFFTTRGHEYVRPFPRQVPAERVAEAIIAAVLRDQGEISVPRWLHAALVFRVLLPALTRAGTRRSFRTELASWDPHATT